MEDSSVLILWAVAFATAVLSAIVGMAGGITLLAAMLLWLPPLVAIPLHGAIQLASNGSRAWIQRRHVDAPILWRYSLPLLPAGLLALAVVRELPEDGLEIAIGVFVLLATWAPRVLLLGLGPAQGDTPASRGRSRFLGVGAVAGLLNVTLGATGPLIAPFFLNLGLTRQQLVGTKAACQAIAHLVKILLFGLVGFAYQDHLPLLIGSIVAVMAGTWFGSRILDRVSEVVFGWLYRGVLTVIALRLVLRPLLDPS